MTTENASKYNRTILITGCSTGIGRDSAVELKERGYRVIATARKQVDVEALKHAGFESLRLDLADDHHLTDAIAEIKDMCPSGLFAIFNNGGFGQPGAVEDVSTEALREQFETNFFGWHTLTRAFIPQMREQGYGRIIQNSSVLGFVAMPFRGAYVSSKFACEGLAAAMRQELKGSNVFISTIQPGPILSDFRKNSLSALVRNVDCKNSFHADDYKVMIARLGKEGAAVPFTLDPASVTKNVILALESKRPKAHYRVTIPTKMLSILRRVLPTNMLDRITSKGV